MWNLKTMSNYTTVKISKETFRLLVRFKALLERIASQTCTFNTTIEMSVLVSDWYFAFTNNLTDKTFDEYKVELFDQIKSQDENVEIDALLEEANALGFDIVKRKPDKKEDNMLR